MDFKRARKGEQIEQRKDEILTLASELCSEFGVMNWSLNELGRRGSITKSNLYRYFGSREEVLMHLLQREMEAFVSDFDRSLGAKALQIVPFSQIIAAHYTNRPFFCELLSVGPTILEHNVDIKPIISIKRSMIGLIQPHAATFMRALNWITADKAAWASQAIAIYVAGLWPIANPAPVLDEICKMPEFECIKFDFQALLSQFASTLLSGCKTSS